MMDPKLAAAIKQENENQRHKLYLIPSENYTSASVREAVGSVLMHKYSEGYPGRRYYEGNSVIDDVELLAISRAKDVFGLPGDWGVNVQPLGGSNANLGVYNALLQPGDKMLGMYLYDGGHLSHGWQWKGKPISITSKIYQSFFYNVNPDTELFDYDAIARVAKEVQPKILISGGTAYSRHIDFHKMAEIAKSVNAYYLADVAHEAGLIAAGLHPSPVGIADIVTMTTHKTLRGPKGAMILAKGELIDKINFAVMPGLQGGPHNGTIAGIAQALFEAQQPEFNQYQQKILDLAQALAVEMEKINMRVVSGGTDKHLVLVDVTNSGFTGKQLAVALDKIGIVVNANTIPGDPRTPMNPSGIRLGTAMLANREIEPADMKAIASFIEETIQTMQQEGEDWDKSERADRLRDALKRFTGEHQLKERD